MVKGRTWTIRDFAAVTLAAFLLVVLGHADSVHLDSHAGSAGDAVGEICTTHGHSHDNGESDSSSPIDHHQCCTIHHLVATAGAASVIPGGLELRVSTRHASLTPNSIPTIDRPPKST